MSENEFSGLLAPMWNCKQHGDFWRSIEEFEEIDTVNDEVYTVKLCPICHQTITPLYRDGLRVMHPLTSEEAYMEFSSAFFDNDDEEEGYNFTCETCGGEFWDGGTSCTCNDDEESDDPNGN